MSEGRETCLFRLITTLAGSRFSFPSASRGGAALHVTLSTEHTRFPLANAHEQTYPLLTEEKGRAERRAFPLHLATNTTELVTGSQRPPACARPCERCQINLQIRATPFMSSLTHLQRRQIPPTLKPGRSKIDT